MFFIFGWGRGTDKDLGPTLPITCTNCHNNTVWHFHEHKKWFTLFFLPLLPYGSKHFLLCPICSHGIQLESNQLDHARSLNSAAQGYLAGTVSEAQFEAILGSGAGSVPLLAPLAQSDVLRTMRDVQAAEPDSTAIAEVNRVPLPAEPRQPMSLFWKATLTLLVILIALRIVWVLMKEGI